MFNIFKKKRRPTIDDILKIENITEKAIALQDLCSAQGSRSTETERIIREVEGLEGEVMNGGFHQYFFNSASDQWPDALIGLEKIGATKSEALLRRALTLFKGSKPSTNRKERTDELASREDSYKFFDDLDREFFKYEDKIQELVIKYAENHKSDFSK